jgi:hypothetical protein
VCLNGAQPSTVDLSANPLSGDESEDGERAPCCHGSLRCIAARETVAHGAPRVGVCVVFVLCAAVLGAMMAALRSGGAQAACGRSVGGGGLPPAGRGGAADLSDTTAAEAAYTTRSRPSDWVPAPALRRGSQSLGAVSGGFNANIHTVRTTVCPCHGGARSPARHPSYPQCGVASWIRAQGRWGGHLP